MKESIQKIIDERLNSPIYSYITFYLVVFNWKALSVLFMSKESVEQRIIAISGASSLWGGFLLPCLVGVLTAMASPYLHNGLSIVHRRAIEWNKEGIAKEEIKNYERIIGTTDIRIRAENSEKLSLKRMEVRESILTARKKKIDSGIVELLDQAKKAEEDKNDFLTQYHRLNAEIEECEKLLKKFQITFDKISSFDNLSEDIVESLKKRKSFPYKISNTKLYAPEQGGIGFEDDIPF